MAVEASVKHIDNSVVNMPLSGVQRFIDDFPIPKPEVTEGCAGYAIDTSNNEYDITVIGYNYIPRAGDTFGGLGTLTTNANNKDVYVLKNGYFICIRNNEVSLHTGGSSSLVTKITLTSALSVSSKIDIDNNEYVAFTTTNDKLVSVFLYDSELNLVNTFDSSSTGINHVRYQASGGLFFIVCYNSNMTLVSVYDFYTGKYLKAIIVDYSILSATHAFANDEFIYILKSNGYLEVYDKDSITLISNNIRTTTETVRNACYFGYKKLFIMTTNNNGFVFDLVLNKSTSTRSYGSTINTACTSDGVTAAVYFNNKFYKIDEQHNIIYENTGFQGNFNASYSFPYFYQRNANNYVYKFKDLSTQILIAKANERG